MFLFFFINERGKEYIFNKDSRNIMEINLAIIDFNPGQGGGGVKPSGSLDISENGVYNVYSYASASVDVHPSLSLSETYISNGNYNITGEFNGGVITVDVPAPQFVTETLNVSANGTYNPGEGVDGYSQVVVDVPIDGWDQKSVTEGTIEIINLDNSASFVVSNAFKDKKNLKTVNLPYATIVYLEAFRDCTSLTQVNLPMCSYIDRFTFIYCSSLSQISLPMCSRISDTAFNNCTSLSQISLPMCSRIDNDAFFACTSLSQISLPMCSHIGRYAFAYCPLTQVSLPMCSFIDDYTFQNCSSLSIITIGYSSVCRLINSMTFDHTQITSSTGSIYVPASLVESYKTATNWTYFSDRIVGI